MSYAESQEWKNAQARAMLDAMETKPHPTVGPTPDAYAQGMTLKILGADAKQVGGSHYKEMQYQPWHAMEDLLTHEEFIGYLKGCVIKYAMRQGRKDGSDDGLKARHYAQKLREVMR